MAMMGRILPYTFRTSKRTDLLTIVVDCEIDIFRENVSSGPASFAYLSYTILYSSLQESNLLWPSNEAGKRGSNVMPPSLVNVFQQARYRIQYVLHRCVSFHAYVRTVYRSNGLKLHTIVTRKYACYLLQCPFISVTNATHGFLLGVSWILTCGFSKNN